MGLLGFSRSDIDVKFCYDVPPYRCFGPFCPVISGTIELKLLKDIKKVVNVRVGLRGTVLASYVSVVKVGEFGSNRNSRTERNTLRESIILFDDERDFAMEDDPSMASIGGNLKAGTFVRDRFGFQFPVSSVYLPSSCTNIGILDDNQGTVNVSYELYLSLSHMDTFLRNLSTVTWQETIPYQGSCKYQIPEPVSFKTYNISNVFRKKVKDFVYDKELKILVPSSMQKAHRHTRLVRSVFDGRYRRDAYSQSAKDVEISCIFSVASGIDVLEPLYRSLRLKLQVKLDSGLEPDFCFNGQSTGLGRFELEEISMIEHYDVRMTVQGHSYVAHGQIPLLLFRYTPSQVEFDIKDFTYNKVQDVWEYDIPLHDPKVGSSAPILHHFPIPAMMCGNVEDIFQCSTTPLLKVKLGNASSYDKRCKTYEVHAQSVCFLGDSMSSLPPPYSA
ncbi:DEKNAAC105642 [Brettanomyces naardenensis]|uniref:DEKNAAC105642 n=1 Tax=Brettanomyces naardenensis TaxID=13370 RepID=A0A448YTZ7_BRENA|nr:DEKNAAC105642 [Brettanomyces naardenensis]